MKKIARSELLEINCFLKMKQNANSCFSWTLAGSNDSTVSDIRVENKKTGKLFYIEVKDGAGLSQAAQFTVDADYKNKVFLNTGVVQTPASKEIIKHMNENFIKFAGTGTKGANVEEVEYLLREHFVQHYQQKSVQFVAFTDGLDIELVDLESASERIRSAKYRSVGNGSSHVSKKNTAEAVALLEDHKLGEGIKIEKRDKKTRLYIKSTEDIGGYRFKGKKITYMVSKKNVHDIVWHEIRQMSSNFSTSVILTLGQKL